MDRERATLAGPIRFDPEVVVPDQTLRAKFEQAGWLPGRPAVARVRDHLSIPGDERDRRLVAPHLTSATGRSLAE